MTEEEFAKLYRNVKWPQTYEGKRATHIVPTQLPELIRRFSPLPLTEDSVPPLSIGSVSNYQRTPRQRLVDYLSQTFYDDDRESRDRIEFLLRPIDVSPAAIPDASYNASRALAEGRYKDAILPGIAAIAPFAAKPTKLIADAVRRRGSMIRTANDLPPKEITEVPNPQRIADVQAPSLGPPPSSSVVPEYRTKVPLYSAKGNGHDKTTDPYDHDFKIPLAPWERSSPWIAPHPPLKRPPRDFSLDYSKEALFDAAGNLRKDVVDDAGNLLKDIEGRKLTAKLIAGRRKVGESDKGLSPDDMYSIIGKDLKAVLYPVSSNELTYRGSIGEVEMYKPPHVRFWNELPSDQVDTTVAHELGHILEEMGGRIRPEGLEDELNLLYSELNTGRSGPPLFLPEHRGYPDYMVPREKGAEAVRAYFTNPNMTKTVAPKTAARLREFNAHPWFKKYLQFNSVPLGSAVGAGVAVTSQGDESQARSLPRHNGSPSVSVNRIRPGIRKAAPALPANRLISIAPVPNPLALIARALLNSRATSPAARA